MKRGYIFLPVALAVILSACGRDEYGGFQKALRHQYLMMDEFTSAAAKASGPEEIAAALEKFRKEAVAGREWMAKLTTEHPGLGDRKKASLPREVRADLAAIEEVTPRFADALLRAEEEYGRDPEVRRALDGIKAVLSPPPR